MFNENIEFQVKRFFKNLWLDTLKKLKHIYTSVYTIYF